MTSGAAVGEDRAHVAEEIDQLVAANVRAARARRRMRQEDLADEMGWSRPTGLVSRGRYTAGDGLRRGVSLCCPRHRSAGVASRRRRGCYPGSRPGGLGVRLPKLPRTRKAVGIAAVATVVGLACLLGSLWLARMPGGGSTATWGSGLLVELGVTVLLLVPLALITMTLERDIETVRDETVASVEQVREETVASVGQVRAETVASVETLTERVSSFEGDVEQPLSDIARSVNDRLISEREHEQALRDAVREVPTRQAVVEMLESAESRGLISLDRAPRVAATMGVYMQMVVGLATSPRGDLQRQCH